MNRRNFAKTLSTVAVGLFLPSHLRCYQQQQQVPQKQSASEPPYHSDPSPTPLPLTLDPEQFIDNPNAFAAYSVSAQIREVLFQVPCYCWCSREQGHQSLLDCFTGRHGVTCGICQREAIYSFIRHKNGKTTPQIRRGLARGKAWRLDVTRYAQEHFPSLSSSGSNRSGRARAMLPYSPKFS
jgi:hypothetical protein